MNIVLKSAEKIVACFVDLDNTLWSGTVAEGEAVTVFADRIEILKQLHRKGIQLFVVSKNDKHDALNTFSSLGIDKEIFTWLFVNWEPKFVNIEHALRVTEIRPETAVFIDDNLFELHEVQQRIPTLHTVIASEFFSLLTIPSIAQKANQSDSEIEERINRYRTALNAEVLRRDSKTNDLDFYRKLKREICFGPVSPDNLERVIKLLVETHRLNFNPGKFANYETAVSYLHERMNHGCRLFAVATTEGGYSLGLTGALLAEVGKGMAVITDGTFSCGIIGRDFEEKTILVLIDKLQQEKVHKLEIIVTANSTNIRVRELLDKLGFTLSAKETDDHDVTHLRYALDIDNYETAGKIDWISVSEKPLTYEYIGHPHVISFFGRYVKPLVRSGMHIANLGSARGEVLGLLQTTAKKEFYDFLAKHDVQYSKIDMEQVSGESNIIANAEDLHGVIGNGSQDIVMAVELLEHTERPWRVVSEMTRICKPGGYIFISVPAFDFPKHEYPIDLWRIGPQTLTSLFSSPGYAVLQLETAGDPDRPRGVMMLVQKGTNAKELTVKLDGGKLDQNTGLTYFG